eukprot:CAMPEP_0119301260 /NCGR_PEP_ID=MMETSP1333-20130426/3065_1 /TAXON_ID=418940 /ORGANISM="Scyphosphaera apsteinii, Strain RCC1455" /LENGTH=644 /DNA_ID=CAMNT_0007303285 /DNA_START=106 /DNA_END=2040 /DNA_ORIENTATION=-
MNTELGQKTLSTRRRLLTLSSLAVIQKNAALVDSRPWFLIHPEEQRHFVEFCDVMVSVALIFTATVTPFEVSFLEPATDVNWLFIVNRLVDLVFLLDLVLQFLLMFKITSTVGISSKSKWEYRPRHIALRYIRGWFTIDVLSMLPSLFDFIPVVSGNSGSFESRVAKMLRVVKVIKLAKLLRLIRSSRLVAKWQMQLSFSYAKLTLFMLFFEILFLSHFFACLLALQTIFSDNQKLDTWLATFGYCSREGPLDAAGKCASEIGCTVRCVEPTEMYFVCFFWALGATAGYTMEPEVGPYPPASAISAHSQRFTLSEQMLLGVVLFFGALAWVYVTAKFVDVLANATPEVTAFRQTMDSLNRFIDFNRLPKELAVRLREYYHATKALQAAKSRARICDGLSDALQEEVSLKLTVNCLRDVRFFRGLRSIDKVWIQPVEDKFLARVAMRLSAAVFAPSEKPPRGQLYIIYGGSAHYQGRFLGVGDTIGEIDVFLPKAPRQYSALALTHLHVFYISGKELDEISLLFPASRLRIRTWALFNGVKEYLRQHLHEYHADHKKMEQSCIESRQSRSMQSVSIPDVATCQAKWIQRRLHGHNLHIVVVEQGSAQQLVLPCLANKEASSESSEPDCIQALRRAAVVALEKFEP